MHFYNLVIHLLATTFCTWGYWGAENWSAFSKVTLCHRNQSWRAVLALCSWTGCSPTVLCVFDHLQHHFIAVLFVKHSSWEIYFVLPKFQSISFVLRTNGLVFFRTIISSDLPFYHSVCLVLLYILVGYFRQEYFLLLSGDTMVEKKVED